MSMSMTMTMMTSFRKSSLSVSIVMPEKAKKIIRRRRITGSSDASYRSSGRSSSTHYSLLA
jgi:hypothetical protein